MSADAFDRARAGDDDAFREMLEPYWRELRLHCYRMLGSLDDAEDALQETSVAAWKAMSQFEGRSSLKTWLYRIATNRCLNLLRTTKRRAAKDWDIPQLRPPKPSRYGKVSWLEPYPDDLLAGANTVAGPEAQYERSESVSLAFIAALQLLPARQRAVLILRDVLGYHAAEVALLLDLTLDSVNSLLKRARARMNERAAGGAFRNENPPKSSAEEQRLAQAFADAMESGNVEALVHLLTDDVTLSMPPIPFEYVGLDAVLAFFRVMMSRGPRYYLVPTHANGQIAFASYLRTASSVHPGNGLAVLSSRGSRIAAITRFESGVFPWFGLPLVLER